LSIATKVPAQNAVLHFVFWSIGTNRIGKLEFAQTKKPTFLNLKLVQWFFIGLVLCVGRPIKHFLEVSVQSRTKTFIAPSISLVTLDWN